MSRVAILADIHANLPALEAVIEDIAQQGVDEVLVGGDMVGRGPQGAAVLARIDQLGWPSVRGNHEDYLIDMARGQVPEHWLSSPHWEAARWMAAELGPAYIDAIAALPFSLIATTAPQLHLVHGSPRSNREGIGPWTDDETLAALFEAIPEPVLICAHTHRPLVKALDGGLVVNVGSVGLPFNGDWRAQYAIIITHEGAPPEVEMRQVPYDRDQFLRAYEETGFLAAGGATSAMLRHEVLHARPFLVPFLTWASALELEPDPAHLPEFLRFYDPERPMRELRAMLEAEVLARQAAKR